MEPMRDNMANMQSKGIALTGYSLFYFGFIGMAKLQRCTGEQAPGWGGRFKTLLFALTSYCLSELTPRQKNMMGVVVSKPKIISSK